MPKQKEYEYSCESCDVEYKIITDPSNDEPTSCPFCGHDEVNRIEKSIVILDAEDEDEVAVESEDE